MQHTPRARLSALTKRSLPALIAAAALAAATPAAAAVSEGEAQQAALDGAAWIQAQQSDDGALGSFGGDWAMIALADAGVHAADVRTDVANPSAQDFYLADWTGAFPLEGSSIARGLLAGRAAGLQPAKLSATENLLAKLAGQFDGQQLGSRALVNDDIFGVLGIEGAGAVSAIAPRLTAFISAGQASDGGWSYGTGADSGDVDMTGAGIAALCSAGATSADPDVAAGLAFLKTAQNEANGGFDSSFFGSNADTTAWAVNGLRTCGIDPQSPDWTTAAGKTPLDFLASLQRDDGAFRWVPGDDGDNLYATQDAITGLVGDGFGAEPPARANPADPALRPAPDVPAGTEVPLALVLDHDPATPGADRICSIEAAVGAPLAEVLEGAATTATPAYCVSGLAVAADRVKTVNGVGEQPGAAVWEASLDGVPPAAALAGTVELGSTISLSLTQVPGGPPAQPATPAPLPQQPAAAKPLLAKARLAHGARLTLRRGGRVRIAVRCPRGLGEGGCPGVVTVKYRIGERLKVAGRSTFSVRSGQRRLVSLRVGRRLRALVRRSEAGRRVRIEAAVRNPETGVPTVSRAWARIAGR
jgi:hypothetical protein